MTESEYRQDDRTDIGYCPLCGDPLSGLTVAARGFCDVHGWQFADWTPRNLTPGVMTGEENPQ